jgi:uncharacterized phosphosugar-binding protein
LTASLLLEYTNILAGRGPAEPGEATEGKDSVPVSATDFFAAARDAIARVEATQIPAIQRASAVLAERMRSGGVVQVFGSGHSKAFSMEMSGRAGGLVPTHAMYLSDLALTGRFAAEEMRDPSFERRPEVARELVGLYDIRPGDAFIIVSNSGRNGVTVEMALIAAEMRLPVVVVTSVAHTSAVTSRHPSGKRLIDLGDVVIDNCAPLGDAVLDTGYGTKVCAVSSVTGAMIAQALTAEIAADYQRHGAEPPVMISANVDGADDHNARLRAPYGSRITWDM